MLFLYIHKHEFIPLLKIFNIMKAIIYFILFLLTITFYLFFYEHRLETTRFYAFYKAIQ